MRRFLILFFIIILISGKAYSGHRISPRTMPFLQIPITLSIGHSWDPCPRDYHVYMSTFANTPYTAVLNNTNTFSGTTNASGATEIFNVYYNRWYYGIYTCSNATECENTLDITIKGRTIRRHIYYHKSPCYWRPDTTETIVHKN